MSNGTRAKINGDTPLLQPETEYEITGTLAATAAQHCTEHLHG